MFSVTLISLSSAQPKKFEKHHHILIFVQDILLQLVPFCRSIAVAHVQLQHVTSHSLKSHIRKNPVSVNPFSLDARHVQVVVFTFNDVCRTHSCMVRTLIQQIGSTRTEQTQGSWKNNEINKLLYTHGTAKTPR